MENLEELFFISVSQDTDLRQVKRYDPHIETTVELVITVFIFPRTEEGTAPHRAEYIPFIAFTHFLRRNIIGVHSLSRAFGS